MFLTLAKPLPDQLSRRSYLVRQLCICLGDTDILACVYMCANFLTLCRLSLLPSRSLPSLTWVLSLPIFAYSPCAHSNLLSPSFRLTHSSHTKIHIQAAESKDGIPSATPRPRPVSNRLISSWRVGIVSHMYGRLLRQPGLGLTGDSATASPSEPDE